MIGLDWKSSLTTAQNYQWLLKVYIFRISVTLTHWMRAWWSSGLTVSLENQCHGRRRSVVYRPRWISTQSILNDSSKWSNTTYLGGHLLSVALYPLQISSSPFLGRTVRLKQSSMRSCSKRREINGCRKCYTRKLWSKSITGWTLSSKNPKLS